MATNPKPTNVERALVEAPLTADDEEIERETENLQIDVSVEEEDGGVEVDLSEEEEVSIEPENFYGNLAELLPEDTLNQISRDILHNVDEDKQSRADWEDTYTKGLDLLGLKYDIRTQPFAGATGVIHPLMNEAVTQFQAGAYKEMLPANGPVRAQIVGTPTPQIEQQAQRVEQYMNYQIMYTMAEYEPEFDQMLYFVGLAGSAFKKVYRDEMLQRPVSKFIPSEDVIVPYSATDVRSAERITHVIHLSQNELRKQMVNGLYLDMEISGSLEEISDVTEKYDELEGKSRTVNADEEVTLYECHCSLDLEEYPDTDESGESTGIKLPYIVTLCTDTQDVLSIRRNYLQEDPKKSKIPHFIQYKFTPGLGFYGFGLIHLLGNLSRTATANLRQLIDAGTLANMPAGFKARGLRIADDAEPLQPGEFRDVDVPGGDLQNSLLPLPYKEPSGTLFQLMGFVIASAEKFIGTTDIAVGDSNQEVPVGTTLALLEKGAKIISSVHKRLHASMKLELKLLAKLFGEDPAPYPYEVGEDLRIKQQDFDDRIDILPVSDPNIFSMSQRVVLAQEQLKLAQAAPEMHNLYEAYRRMYEALGVNNIDQILKSPTPPQPIDPSTENQNASQAATGQGQLTAYPEQDHDAHIAVHLGYMQSQVAQLQPPVLMTLEKHIYQHIGMKAMVIAQQQLPPQQAQAQAQDPNMMAAKVAQIQAELVADFLRQNPKQQGDPLVDIKQKELQLRAQKQADESMREEKELGFEKQRLAQQTAVARERIDSQEDIAAFRGQIARERQQSNTNNQKPR
jgi:hypothetical protein